MPPSFVSAINKCPVVAVVEMRNHNRASKAAPVCVADELCLVLGCWIRVGNGVERSVLVIPERRSVNSVGTALRGHRDLTRLSKFGIVLRAICAQFRDGFAGRKSVCEWRIACRALDGDTVYGDLSLKRQATLQGERLLIFRCVAICLDTRECCDNAERAGAVGARARVHRQVGNVGGAIDSADRRSLRIDGADRITGDLDFLLNAADHQGCIQTKLLAGSQSDPRSRPLLKSVACDLHCIVASLHIRKEIIS